MPRENPLNQELQNELAITSAAIKKQSRHAVRVTGKWFRRHPVALGVAIAAPAGLLGWKLWRSFKSRDAENAASRGRSTSAAKSGSEWSELVKVATRGIVSAAIARITQPDVDVKVKTPAGGTTVQSSEDVTVERAATVD